MGRLWLREYHFIPIENLGLEIKENAHLRLP